MLEYDVIVVGSGIAGLYGALQFPENVRVLVISKKELQCSNSSLAQGGIAGVLDLNNDSYDLHIKDTLAVGKNMNDLKAVEILVREGPTDILNLKKLGVDFDQDEQGEFLKKMEGGHSCPRVVYHRNSTGKAIVDVLIEQVIMRPNIDLVSNARMFDLKKTTGGFVAGVLHFNKVFIIKSRFVLMASGGIGCVYPYTTNSSIATGDGIMFAYELGAKIKHLNWIQFHPTTFACSHKRERFLISEAVRNEGAHLLNAKKRPFILNYDKRGDLAPGDIIAESICKETLKQGNEEIYLDIRYKDSNMIKARFPMLYQRCLHEGIDITRDVIPVYPSQHYLIGGIDVDLNGRSSVDGLYAAGECSHTGVHGRNRLASNSLLEALVFSRRAANDMILRLRENPTVTVEECEIRPVHGPFCQNGYKAEIRKMIYQAHFVLNRPGLFKPYLKRVNEILEILKSQEFELTQDYLENLSLATITKIILEEDINEYES